MAHTKTQFDFNHHKQQMFQSICDGSNIAASLSYSLEEENSRKHQEKTSKQSIKSSCKPTISVSALKQAQKKPYNM